jgi:parvulin-like peptidyl-prolyl isomerase
MDAHVKQLAVLLFISLFSATHLYAQDVQEDVGRPTSLPPGASGPYRVASLATAAPGVGLSNSIDSSGSGKEFEAAKIIARVGDEVVLAGDLYGQVNQFLHNRLKEVPESQRALLTPELLNERRWQLMEQVLPQIIDGKLVYLDFLRSIPPERIPDIQDSLYKAFDEQRLPSLIEQANVQTAADLDSLLRSFGSSLDQQRRTFAEQLAAMQWKERSANSSKEISHQDLVDYYRAHIEDYRIVAKSRWEQLSALDSKTFSRDKSRQLVAEMGNEVFRGAAFAAVAKRSSHGVTASSGGSFDWTTKDSLRSEKIDEAIFSLPVGSLSRIIEDDAGCHIVRVIERQEASTVPFSEVQGTIREKIRGQRSEEALQEYVEKLRTSFPVWTMFDKP